MCGVIRSDRNEYVGGSLVVMNAAEKIKGENGLRDGLDTSREVDNDEVVE